MRSPERSALRRRAAIAALLLAAPGVALAGAPRTWSGEIDGVPAWVTVVPRNGEIAADAGPSWTTWGDAVDDAYLFAFETPDRVRLALDFAPRGEGVEVRLRAERPGEEPLRFELDGDRLSFERPPLYRLWTESGPWVQDGLPTYDLRWESDGRYGKENAPVDGVADFAGRVAQAEPGVPAWQTSLMVNDPHPSWGYPRFGFAQRLEDAPPFRLETPLWPEFPFLGISWRPGSWFEANLAPLHFRLDRNEFDTNSFVGFHFGGMYQIGSIAPPPDVSFESPFAFYRLDPDNDTRYADLVVRSGGRSPAYDRYSDAYGRGVEETDFRYSWKTFERTRWSYSLNVSGNVGYPDLQSYGDGEVEFYAPAPETLPSWVVEQEWGVVNFVEATETFHGSEGIYFYTAQARPVRPWRLGASNAPPEFFEAPYLPEDTELRDAPDESLPLGFRGEYGLRYQAVPALYLSPIDNRLHLERAEGGLWHVAPGRVLRTADRDGDGRQDVWTLERVPPLEEQMADRAAEAARVAQETGEPIQEIEPGSSASLPRALPGEILARLYALDDVLVLDDRRGAGRVVIKRLDAPIVDTPVPAPADAASWTAHRDLLATVRGLERDPLDLASWLEAFAGVELVVEGASVERLVRAGEAFEIRVDASGATAVTGALPGNVTLAAPGRWRIGRGGPGSAWVIAPDMRVPVRAEVAWGDVRSLLPASSDLRIVNPAGALRGGPATLRAGKRVLAEWEDVPLAPGETTTLRFAWLPDREPLEGVELHYDGAVIAVAAPAAAPPPSRPFGLLRGFWITMEGDALVTLALLGSVAVLLAGTLRARRWL